MGSSPAVKVAPGVLLKTLDQAAGWLPWLPTSHKQGMPAGHKASLPAGYFQLHVVGKVGDREGCWGRQRMGLATGHYKQPGPGLLVLGRRVTVASVRTQPGPANVQGDPKRHAGPRQIQNKQHCWQRECCAGDSGTPLFVDNAPF